MENKEINEARTCPFCRKEYQTEKKSIYCSLQCRTKAATELRKRRRRETKAKYPEAICARCSKPFKPFRIDAKYCSIACKQAGYRKKNKKETENGLVRIRKIVLALRRKPHPFMAYKLVCELRELEKKRYPLSSRSITILTRNPEERVDFDDWRERSYIQSLLPITEPSKTKEISFDEIIKDKRKLTNSQFKEELKSFIEKSGKEFVDSQTFYVNSYDGKFSKKSLEILDKITKNILAFIGKDGFDLVDLYDDWVYKKTPLRKKPAYLKKSD